MIDIDSLMKGANYSDLKESYIIFICLDDPFDNGLPVYSFERVCKEDKAVELGDKTHHVVFNCSAYDKEPDAELKDFLTYVKNNKAESKFTKEIANMVQNKKFEQTFVNEYLAWNLHDQDVERRGIEQGLKQGIAETAKRLLALGLPIETIKEGTGLSEEEIMKLK